MDKLTGIELMRVEKISTTLFLFLALARVSELDNPAIASI